MTVGGKGEHVMWYMCVHVYYINLLIFFKRLMTNDLFLK